MLIADICLYISEFLEKFIYLASLKSQLTVMNLMEGFNDYGIFLNKK